MQPNRKRTFLYGLLVSSCLSLLTWAGPVSSAGGPGGEAAMPKQCRPGKTATESFGWRWRPDARVRLYYLKGDFGAEEAAALARAVGNWNNALREINSQVVFIQGGEREAVAEDDASITVLRGVPKGKDRLGQLRLYSMSNGVMRATMIISPAVTDLDALTSLMAHELGHSLGLGDCYGCKRGTTTMAAFKDINEGNDVYSPSECDKYVVAQGYSGGTTSQPRPATAEGR
ncbi:MAG TPA: hypothetical protein VN256_15205 [Pyrinomonadaceae bacterium]|nr:hypothetical protein [Pyrinomonadaceae bacterium]